MSYYAPEDDLVDQEFNPGYMAGPSPIKKETHMPERLTKAQIEHELRVNENLMRELELRKIQLLKQKQTAIPAEPPPGNIMFTVAVRFTMRGKYYQFLILRSGRKYFTTGTKAGQQKFDSWADLIGWLEGEEVYDHSDLQILSSSGRAVSFTSGAIERMDPAGEPPF